MSLWASRGSRQRAAACPQRWGELRSGMRSRARAAPALRRATERSMPQSLLLPLADARSPARPLAPRLPHILAITSVVQCWFM